MSGRKMNLDTAAAEYAQRIVQDHSKTEDEAQALERLATKALGVFQENGVYAGLLLLYSRSETEQPYACTIRKELLDLLSSEPIKPLGLEFAGNKNSWSAVSEHLIGKEKKGLTDDLDSLLLVKELYEQTLIYVRYGAKAAAIEAAARGKAKKQETVIAEEG